MTHAELAVSCFLDGANCAQAVFAAFRDELGIDEAFALRLASSFGGGLGRQREVCGAVSGMCMAAGALFGYDDVKDPQQKADHYALVQELCAKFKEKYGTIICRDLLKLTEGENAGSTPTPRTPAFYRDRPCAAFVEFAAETLEEYVAEHREKIKKR